MMGGTMPQQDSKMINRIEVIVDAIGRLNCSHDPTSLSYRLRNPLLLKSFALPGRHSVELESGCRIFDTFLGGYKSACFDVSLKLKGLSRAGLKPQDQLRNLLGCYGISSKQAIDTVVNFIRRALNDQSISADTLLSFFLEEVNGR